MYTLSETEIKDLIDIIERFYKSNKQNLDERIAQRVLEIIMIMKNKISRRR